VSKQRGVDGSSTPLSSSLLDPRSSTPQHNDLDGYSPGMPRGRSRTSSISSQTSDAASFMSSASNQPTTPSFQGAGWDTEGSVSEADTEDASGVATALNKDELFRMYCKVQRRGQLYKSKLSQVLTAYKESEKERDKLKVY